MSSLHLKHQEMSVEPFIAIFLIFVGVFVILILTQKKLNIGNWLIGLVCGLAAVAIPLAGRVKIQRDQGKRQVLLSVDCTRLKEVDLSHGSKHQILRSQDSIASLFALLQTAHTVHAHHSSPEDSYRIKFRYQGETQEYDIAQDSDISTEYWLMDIPRESFDLGRVQSTELGPLLKKLLDTPEAPSTDTPTPGSAHPGSPATP